MLGGAAQAPAKAAFRTWAPKSRDCGCVQTLPTLAELALPLPVHRHPDHCAWFEECDASALWLGPIDVGDGFMYTTYEVWGRAETV